MSSNLQYRVPHTADSDVKVANSHFCDDEWDLAPLFSQSSISPNYKKLRFDDIRNEKLKLITKQYLYYKLGQIKARTVVAVRYRLNHFIRFCEIHNIESLRHITSRTLITFAVWLKTEHNLNPITGHFISYSVEVIMRKIPIAYVMKQYSHVSAEMTCYYLTLQEREIKQLYAQMLFSPDAKIAGMFADELKAKTLTMFRGKTECDIENVIDHLSESISFNPLPGGVCLYDYRRGNCSNGDGCFFYNCPNFITEVSFLPVLRKELKLMEQEMARTKRLGYERQWQIQHSRYLHLKPLVEKLEGDTNG